ncbi:unnamed protein product [Psylliodes chrysocephalus]|uniref:28S ribosomal protein S27, mitochondrial n=1 Tax=Psylliodes chrysocephalus TaxID=3402493 RepID=A0A9P0CN46_9CUCU|nr:unnamed protein product [Psylliodes chrysocephala]
MFKLIQKCAFHNKLRGNVKLKNVRTFLSQAYYCQEVWDRRLNSPILQKVNLDEFYYELDQRFQKTRELSAVDVDIFANVITNDKYTDELLDVVHKLRLTADTCNTLNSTSHALVRCLLQFGNMENLLNILDDRLNYGLFLDYYTANLLMDVCWKNKDYTSGARVASQLMLQEEFDHPVSHNLALLHCYNYLLKPEGWPVYPAPEEPEEDVKVRVRFIRNPYDDEHFDLRDPNKIVGKTLAMFTKAKDDSLNKSFNVLGNALFNKLNKVESCIKDCQSKNIVLFKEIIDLVPNESEAKKVVSELKLESSNISDILENKSEHAVNTMSERDVADQCKLFLQWEEERHQALEIQKDRLSKIRRLKEIEDLQQALKEKETKLWFFKNEENIELAIEQKELASPKEEESAVVETDDNYIPPEVHSRQKK